jgi:hypothetical protein
MLIEELSFLGLHQDSPGPTHFMSEPGNPLEYGAEYKTKAFSRPNMLKVDNSPTLEGGVGGDFLCILKYNQQNTTDGEIFRVAAFKLFDKGLQQLLWTSSRTAYVKITKSGRPIFTRLNCCVIFIVYLYIYTIYINVAAGHVSQSGKPWVGHH